ncbi:MAG: hypothetical protein HOW73_18825 [Polyangiaceae bacterium]|nr:hypothetical protein [Polyangiaceae bacterium]
MNTSPIVALSPLIAGVVLVLVACPEPNVPESSCKVVPPQTSDASATQEQAAKLNAKVVNMPVEGSAEAENRASAQINETYQAVPDKQAACAMLFQTIECLERRNANSQLAARLADNVGSLCGGGAPPPAASSAPSTTTPPPPAETSAPSASTTPPASSAQPAPVASVTPVTSPEAGVTQCSVKACGLATKTSCEITCRAPKQAKCSCDSCGGLVGVSTCLKENCRCE